MFPYAGWTGVSSIVIMEDCGGNEPDGDKWNLYSFANPSGCTGNALAAPSGGGGGATNYLHLQPVLLNCVYRRKCHEYWKRNIFIGHLQI